jgi:hypothetical protein
LIYLFLNSLFRVQVCGTIEKKLGKTINLYSKSPGEQCTSNIGKPSSFSWRMEFTNKFTAYVRRRAFLLVNERSDDYGKFADRFHLLRYCHIWLSNKVCVLHTKPFLFSCLQLLTPFSVETSPFAKRQTAHMCTRKP